MLAAGADTELRSHRTGTTALYEAVTNRKPAIIAALLKGGADPDAANHWGITPRRIAQRFGNAGLFVPYPKTKGVPPPPQIQNAEHLAENHHPNFQIPTRTERERLHPGQQVGVYVYGPRVEGKTDTVQVQITERQEHGDGVRYRATVQTPIEQTHLRPDIQDVAFGPEHIATIFHPR
ncbi:MAG: hypothetical protein AAFV53_01085 [Myxococcota bacterium]